MAEVIRIPSPGAMLGLARSTVELVLESTVVVASLPARALGLIDAAESLVDRIGTVVDRAEELIARTERVVGEAEFAVREVETITAAAATVVATADVTSSIANEIVRVYEPIAAKAAPLAERFVAELSAEEVEAAVKLVDELPVITGHMVSNVLPILATLDRVGPDVTELLNVTREVRRAIVGIPGFKFFRRRGAERMEEQN
jgi:hypothetical protein